MAFKMGDLNLISVANYLGYLEGKGQIVIDEEEQLYGLMEAIDEDVDKAARCTSRPFFDFWTEVEAALKRHYTPLAE